MAEPFECLAVQNQHEHIAVLSELMVLFFTLHADWQKLSNIPRVYPTLHRFRLLALIPRSTQHTIHHSHAVHRSSTQHSYTLTSN